ncbi:MAG: hypothetical protein A2X46_04925 [Lentisphaerae bacterium GWF2_57_35]|nr:MAG: hypothetical protein A2X46_04925 [Lentisphaerae bacterium GWF2_57_35]
MRAETRNFGAKPLKIWIQPANDNTCIHIQRLQSIHNFFGIIIVIGSTKSYQHLAGNRGHFALPITPWQKFGAN